MSLAFHRQLMIASPTLSDEAVVSAANTPPTMSAENLLSYQPTDWMRVTSALDSVVIDVYMPDTLPYPYTEVEWTAVMPMYTNAGEDDVWRVTASPTLGGLSSPTFDTGWMNLLKVPGTGRLPWKHGLYWTERHPDGSDAGVRTERFLRIYVDASGNPDGFLQWGRLYVCKPWQPPNHCNRGVRLLHDEQARRVETEGGASRVARRPRPRVLEFGVDFVSREEMLAEGYEIDSSRGISGDVAVVYDPDSPNLHKMYLYGTMQSPEPMQEEDGDDFSHAYKVRELL
jgi:hypothetical protein